MPAVTSGPLLKLPPRRSWEGAAHAPSSVQSRAAWDGARQQRPHSELCPPHRCLASRRQRQLPRYETGRLFRRRPVFVSLMICRAGLRGRAPFSCGKKRALPLKLPLPPKTAHGKARSTRLPLFRAKNTRRGSDNRNAARRMSAIPAPPAACRQEQHARPCCASRRPPAKLHIQPQVSLNAPGQHFLKGGRKRTLKDFGVREKTSACPTACASFSPPGRGRPR